MISIERLKKKIRRSLINKIVTAITLLVAFTSLVSIYSFYVSNNQVAQRLKSKQREYIISQIELQKQKRIEKEISYIDLYAKAIKGAVAQSLYRMDRKVLEGTLISFAKLESINSIYIFDDIMEKFYFGIRRDMDGKLDFVDSWPEVSHTDNKIIYTLHAGKKQIGKMEVVYNMRSIIKALEEKKMKDLEDLEIESDLIKEKMHEYLLWQILIFIISMILLLFLISYLLYRIVNIPLKTLQKNMYDFFQFFKNTKKKLSLTKIDTHDEFEEISEEINKNIETVLDIHHELKKTQEEILFIVGSIAEAHSKETGLHVKRVSEYSRLLAKHCGLSEDEVHLVGQASAMHDIGKIAIPESILLKPSKLTDEEFAMIKSHSVYGYNILRHSDRDMIKTAAIIAYEHHEKYNGQGYPRGLKGEEIHIYGRIVALADVFDALSTERVYKKAWSDDRIFSLFKEERGEAFDPKLVDIFFEHLDDFLKIRDELKEIY